MRTPRGLNNRIERGLPMRPESGASRRRRRGIRLALIAGVIGSAAAAWVISRRGTLPLPPLPHAYPFVLSPNVDDRPPGASVTCVVIHSTVLTTLNSTVKTFLSPATRVSAHFVVDKTGCVVQMAPVERRAWHAGKSLLKGMVRVNDFSVGIELVNRNDGRDPYPLRQVEAAAGIIRLLRSRYTIPDNRIVSHAQVAVPAGRKSDPAGFDFELLRRLAAGVS